MESVEEEAALWLSEEAWDGREVKRRKTKALGAALDAEGRMGSLFTR